MRIIFTIKPVVFLKSLLKRRENIIAVSHSVIGTYKFWLLWRHKEILKREVIHLYTYIKTLKLYTGININTCPRVCLTGLMISNMIR